MTTIVLIRVRRYMSTLASVAGLAHRVGQLLDTADAVLKTYERFDKENRVVKSGHIELVDVSCTTPDGHPLFKNMSFAIRRRQCCCSSAGRVLLGCSCEWAVAEESMLIMGPSGAGKVGRVGVYSGASAAHYLVLFGVICAELSASSHGGSMVRVVVLSWLWLPRAYSSQLTPVIFFAKAVPRGCNQTPFQDWPRRHVLRPTTPLCVPCCIVHVCYGCMCDRAICADLIENGTLRDQLIYPHTQDYMRTDDARLVELLRAVDLNFVLERAEDGLDTRAEWGEILSGGEQQRVGFVRLLYHRPVFAIMVCS